ncbi:helix-turn-helix transcriptional regulator [Actinacidiphila epipremni]|uniref:AAA family ATPase n=1 Tax=Actinacidiphila epipremni TaxID=2053013 RepID=A0ABX0ZGS8_9ACTN|nr:AAA family ATPase [Actinacidiphila epipremni]NJP42516.1 AAA family ATPase [Actinacidiphila epipremni]
MSLLPPRAAVRTAPLIGRRAEMERVTAALAAAAAGRGSALFVTGEPGAGRTRLAAEALAAAGAAGLAAARGGVSAVAPPAPYRPLIEALLSLARTGLLPDSAELDRYGPVLAALGVPPRPPAPGGPDAVFGPYTPQAPPADAAGPRYAGARREHGGVEGDFGGCPPDGFGSWLPPGTRMAVGLLPAYRGGALGSLTARPAADGWGPLVVGEALLRVLGTVGRARGCLLVLDDLQDADVHTLAAVEYLLDNLAGQPVALLLTAGRAAGAAADLGARACQRGVAEALELGPLHRADVRRLLAAESGASPDEVGAELLDEVVADCGGNPYLVRELARDLAARGATRLRPGAVPPALARGLARRVDRLGPGARAVLGAAALFGPRFPLPVLRRTVDRGDQDLTAVLDAATASSLVEPDPEDPGWYGFRHPIAARAVRDALTPGERVRYARRAVAALAELHPGLPGDWCGRAAALCGQAGDTAEAVRLTCEAGRRAVADGAVQRAVALLRAAHRPGDAAVPGGLRADVLEALLSAAGHAARYDLLPELTAGVEALDGREVPAGRRAVLCAGLADLAVLAGHPAQALHHLDVARRLLGDSPAAGHTAPVDAAAARVEPHRLAPDRLRTARHAARRAVDAARGAGLPEVECRALVLLGGLTAPADPQAAGGHLLAACALARQHRLPAQRVTAEIGLALLAARHEGRWAALEQARQEAARLGVLPPAHEAGFALALDEIRRGRFAAAAERFAEDVPSATRQGLGRALPLLHLADAIAHAHQGQRAAMQAALDRLTPYVDDAPGVRAMSYGLARAFCSLLEEEREAAEREFAQGLAYDAENPATCDVGRHGPGLLLGVLAGRVGRQHCAQGPAGDCWNQVFAGMAHAVLRGREGRPAEADAAARTALDAAAAYPQARHLAVRLVARDAYEHGWGDPVGWLREAEEHFHAAGLPAVAGACRGLLRGMGAQVRQRRAGIEGVPPALRRHGVTVREFEVARLLAARIGNKDIAGRLHISPRTVEKHVASLLRKTGHPDRAAFATAAAELIANAG